MICLINGKLEDLLGIRIANLKHDGERWKHDIMKTMHGLCDRYRKENTVSNDGNVHLAQWCNSFFLTC